MQFAKVRLSCVGCRASITDEKQSTALCTHCLAREPEHLQKALNTVNDLERDFNRLWTQCQRCQGSLHQDVLCTSRLSHLLSPQESRQGTSGGGEHAQAVRLVSVDERGTWGLMEGILVGVEGSRGGRGGRGQATTAVASGARVNPPLEKYARTGTGMGI